MIMTSGSGVASIIQAYKPSFVWDPYRGNVAVGSGETSRAVNFDIVDEDAITPVDAFSVWDAGNERFKVIDPAVDPEQALGTVGDFSDGKIQNYWSTNWTTTNLGLSVTAPTTAAMLDEETGVPADIIVGGSLPDVTYVDTSEAQDSVVEKSNSKSSSYARVFQILVKSEDGNAPDTNVEVGMNLTSGTRTTDGVNTWSRALPGAKGWYAVMYYATAGTTNYITMSFKQGTGRWFLSAPMFYNKYTGFGNIVRAPIPRYAATKERGQYSVNNTTNIFTIPVAGWMAGCVVLPDRSVSNGHLDYTGAGQYSFGGVMGWQAGTYRIRMIMSTTYDRLAIQMDNGGTSFAFLEFPADWDDFEPFGFVVTWGIVSGTEYANLYVNGEKLDSVYGTTDWFPEVSTPATFYIGKDGASGAASDAWVNRLMLGRKPMHRSEARMLSAKMLTLTRGGKA